MAELKYKIGTERNPILIALKEFKGRKLIDIRKHFLDSNNKTDLIPTKKGISLNESQLIALLNELNENKVSIQKYFDQINDADLDINLNIGSTLGRKFQFDFENKKTDFYLDSDLAMKIGEPHIEMVKKTFYSFYSALLDVLEDDDEIELILDVFSNKLNRTKW
jgi:hypothetical protein